MYFKNVTSRSGSYFALSFRVLQFPKEILKLNLFSCIIFPSFLFLLRLLCGKGNFPSSFVPLVRHSLVTITFPFLKEMIQNNDLGTELGRMSKMTQLSSACKYSSNCIVTEVLALRYL